MNDEIQPVPTPDSPLDGPTSSGTDPLAPARETVAREEGQTGAGDIPGPAPWSGAPAPLATTQDERIVSALAHLMAFFSFAWLPLIINVAIYLIWRDRSKYVRFQGAQALAYSLALATATWLTVGIFGSNPLLWCLLVPCVAILALGHLYSLWGAAATLGGRNFVYLGVGQVVSGLLDKPKS